MYTDVNTYRFPRTISLGIKDNTKRALPITESTLPQCIPLIYTFAQKGRPEYTGTGVNAAIQYGDDTFDPLSKYFTHHTELRNILVAQAAATCCVRRLVPKDAGVRANVVVWMDVLETMIPNYKRNSTGDYRYENGLKVLDDNKPYIPGHLIKWYSSSLADEVDYGLQKVREGTLARWDFPEGTLHMTIDQLDLGTNPTGHTQYADKTIYIYNKLSDIYEPETGFTTRTQYEVDAGGTASMVTEQLFNPDETFAVKSKLYPIIEAKAAYQGSYYNRLAFSIAASTSLTNSKYIEQLKAIPYTMTRYIRNENDVNGTIYKTLSGNNSVEFTFVNNGINPTTKTDFSFESMVNSGWDKENFEEIEYFHFYRENWELLLNAFAGYEKEYVSYEDQEWADHEFSNTSAWYDFTDVDAETVMSQYGLINPFLCQSKKGIDYFTIKIDYNRPESVIEGFQEENLTLNGPVFLRGGNDGTMNDEVYEQLIQEDLARYADIEDEYQEAFVHPENFLVDTGFSLEVKKAFAKFIAVKKNTIILLSSHYASLKRADLSLSDIDAMTTSLVAELKLSPESETFATPTCRASIIVGTGDYGKGKVRKPLTLDTAIKIVKFMGGSDRKWVNSYRFDVSPTHNITELKNIKPAYIPPSIMNNLWRNGISYPKSAGDKYYIPAINTVYGDDTSVLSSLMNVLCIPHIERINLETWKQVVGTAGLSNAVFINNVEAIASSKVVMSFAGIVKARPQCIIDESDAQRGYTWHLNWYITAYNAKTIQVTSSIFETSIDNK